MAVCAGRTLRPTAASHSFEERAATEVLTDYGQRYWKAYAPSETEAPPEDWIAAVQIAAAGGADWW